MTLNELIQLQKQFDGNHMGKFKWDQQINDNNLDILEYLLLCLVGEFGETTNLVKKVLRGDCALEDIKDKLSDEIVDMFIYIIKLSYQLNINLEECYLKKLEFNKSRFARFKVNENE